MELAIFFTDKRGIFVIFAFWKLLVILGQIDDGFMGWLC